MSKFTVIIPDDLLADAKVMAAKTGTSLSATIRTLLEGFVRAESAPLTGNYEILLKFSLGQMTAQDAVKNLHLADEFALSKMLLDAGLPLPRLSLQETEAMQKRFSKTLDYAGQRSPK